MKLVDTIIFCVIDVNAYVPFEKLHVQYHIISIEKLEFNEVESALDYPKVLKNIFRIDDLLKFDQLI